MTQPPEPDWSTRLALSVAREVRRHRQAAGMSAQQLADRCSEIGMPIKRSVLANLESGRRTTVSISEVLVLAAALDIPPALLVFPVGYEEAQEVLPKAEMEPLQAVDWFSGVSAEPVRDRPFANNTLFLFRRHRSLVNRMQRQFEEREYARARFMAAGSGEEADRLEMVRGQIERLRTVVEGYHEGSREGGGDVPPDEREIPPGVAQARERLEELTAFARNLEGRDREYKWAEQTFRRIEIDLIHLVQELKKVRIDIEDAGWVVPRLDDNLRVIISEMRGPIAAVVDDVDDFTDE